MKNRGVLTVITGPMGSGKTELLIEKYTLNKAVSWAFKPNTDTRKHGKIHSRNHSSINALEVKPHKPFFISDVTGFDLLPSLEILNIFISEVQFFTKEIIEVIQRLLNRGQNVFVEGLTTDFKGNKFGYTTDLVNISDKHIHLTIKCERCKNHPAEYNYRLPIKTQTQQIFNQDRVVLIGGSELYRAICSSCFELSKNIEGLKDF